jgi:hypothetical protein
MRPCRLSLLRFRIALLWSRDDLSAHGGEPRPRQGRVKAFKQKTLIAGTSSMNARVCASRKSRSSSRPARDRRVSAKKAHERQPVLDQIFGPLVRQRMARLQNQNPTHQDAAIGRAPTLDPVSPWNRVSRSGRNNSKSTIAFNRSRSSPLAQRPLKSDARR